MRVTKSADKKLPTLVTFCIANRRAEIKDKIIFETTPRSAGKKMFYSILMDANKWHKSTWTGVDWIAGNGMIRGEVIKRDRNVTYVRFNSIVM